MLSMRETSAASLRSLVISAAIARRSMLSTISPICNVSRAAQAKATEGVLIAVSSK